MYKIIIEPKVRKTIEKYIDAYEIYYENLYTDSGLGIAEEIIIHQYRESALAIAGAFYDSIEDVLSPEEILGYKPIGEYVREVSTRIESRRIFLTYREESGSRSVEDIKIVHL